MKNLFRISGVILFVLSIFLIHSCKKDKPSPPVITAIRISSISYNTAISGGNVIDEGGAAISARGVCWSTSPNPTISLSTKTIDSTGTGEFKSSITGLTAGTTYYVKAYATNNVGNGYGSQLVFTTTLAKIPFLITTTASSIKQTYATSGGFIASDRGASITARGVCWSTSANPTTADSKTNDGAGLGSFTSSITGLTANTTYYVKAYALNSVGTSYGNELTFTTSVAPSTVPGAPTIGTASAGNAQAVVTFTASVSNGGSAITGYTVTSSPGGLTGTGTASPITVSGLTNGTAYTFTVTATNAIGTSVASSASNSVTPSTVPDAPTIGTATAGNAQAVVTFTAPVSNGGSEITGYRVTSSPGGFTSTGTASPITVSGLTNGTAYTFTVTATNAIGTGVASSASNSVTALLTDIDGNVYNIVTIGTQVWMAENLKTTKYNDGTAIPNITDNTAWFAATTGAYSDYSNTPGNSTTYGRLYNWYAVDNNTASKVASNGGKNVCPTSWHVPSDAEWTTLTTNLGGVYVAGGKLKETGTTHWTTPNTGATNETGFTALPGGGRYEDGTYSYIGDGGIWWSSTWSSTAFSTTTAWYWVMSYNDSYLDYDDDFGRQSGFSVRCLRDF